MSGVGIDLLDVDRFEQALSRRPGLRNRLFDPSELAACERAARPARHLAARFCAKEAAVKALGLRGVGLSRIVICGGFGTRPTISVDGSPMPQLHVSITHERAMAAAVVVAA